MLVIEYSIWKEFLSEDETPALFCPGDFDIDDSKVLENPKCFVVEFLVLET